MKKTMLLFSLLIFCKAAYGQKLEIQTGLISSYGYYQTFDYNVDKKSRFLPFKLFPTIGYRVNFFNSNQKYQFQTGMEFLQIGAQNYDTFNYTIKLPPDFRRFLKLSSIRVPLILKISTIRNLYYETGFSLNYSFRKNHSFYYELNENNFVSNYQPFTYQYINGLSYYWKKLIIRSNFNLSINPVFDTGKIFQNRIQPREYLRNRAYIHNFAFTIGYRFS